MAPLHIQRLILFLMQRGTKDFSLNVGGLFIESLECFATVRKLYIIKIYNLKYHNTNEQNRSLTISFVVAGEGFGIVPSYILRDETKMGK